MTIIGVCMLSVILLCVWVAVLEMRLNFYKKSLLKIIDGIQTQSDIIAKQESKIAELKNTIINHRENINNAIHRLNRNTQDISEIIKAINNISQEEFGDDVLKEEKTTIQ